MRSSDANLALGRMPGAPFRRAQHGVFRSFGRAEREPRVAREVGASVLEPEGSVQGGLDIRRR